ncbi:MAG: tetratricopeptide repeat protein [Planctomycetota bacterium]
MITSFPLLFLSWLSGTESARTDLVPRAQRLAIAQEAFEAGDFEIAREELLWALRMQPSDPAVAAKLSLASEKLGEADEAVYYAFTALEQRLAEDEPDKEAVKEIQDRIGTLSPAARALKRSLDRYVDDLVKLGRLYFTNKLYAMAADTFGRALALDPATRSAAEYLEKIQKASGGEQAAAVLASRIKRSRSPAWIARRDRAHRDWAKAYSQRTPNYVIKTNIGFDVFQKAVGAMEVMNGFYRRVFRYKEKGGGTPILQIYLLGSRAEYEGYRPGVGPGVRGHYNSTEVVTYDPRTDGGELDQLWQTLFHEASHQFTDLVTNVPPSTWLNEGLATYFEGARFREDGSVETNGIPRHRFGPLMLAWSDEAAKHGLTSIPLRRLIAASKEEYDANYYNHGWGLIYYLRNWENDAAENIYHNALDECLKSYKKGGKHDPVERFEKYFIAGVERPEIKTIEDLERDWREWLTRLLEEYRKGPLAAAEIAARGDFYRTKGKLEKARAAYERVLEFLPGDRDSRRKLAEVNGSLGRTDEALRELYRLVAESRLKGEPADSELEAKARELDPLAAERASGDQQLREEVLSQVGVLTAEGLSMTAMLALKTLERVLGAESELAQRVTDIEKTSGKSLKGWRWIFNGENLDGWEGTVERCRAAELGLEMPGDQESCTLVYGEEFSGDRMIRMRVWFGDSELAVFGFVFALGGDRPPWFALFVSNGQAILAHYDAEAKDLVIDKREKIVSPVPGERVALEIVGESVRLFAEDRLALYHELPGIALDGRVGVRGERAKLRLEEIEVKP